LFQIEAVGVLTMLYTKDAPYVYSRDGVYYFNRRIPNDLRHYYRCPRIIISLRTKSARAAKSKSSLLAAQLNDEWMSLRWRSAESPLKAYLADQTHAARELSTAPLMSEAKNIYLKSKGVGRPRTFSQAVDRAITHLINTVGDKPLDTYSRKDANMIRDVLFERGLNRSSIKRMFGTIRALVNFVSREVGLSDLSAFSGVYLGENNQQSDSRRQPIDSKSIRYVQKQCELLNDEGRWLIALISDTGMRLSEAIGLHMNDINLNNEYPHIILKPHSWRRLKTKGSERIIPLVGVALWAVKQAMSASETSFLFPRYCDNAQCKSNSASAALNKWLSPRVGNNCVIHSFRHSFRDRLRAVECPKDMTDRLGGWSVEGIGESYGLGYPIEVLSKWMVKAMC
jgi:integrase